MTRALKVGLILPMFSGEPATVLGAARTAEDLGFPAGSAFPFLTARGVNFINNDAINGQSVLAGPGVLSGPARISFTTLLQGFENFGNALGSSLSGPAGATTVWGTFNESPDSIILFPNNVSLQQLESLVLGQ